MIGKRLEQLRKTKVISQRQLALRIGVAATTISRYERDLFKPKKQVLTRLADFFEVDPNVFCQSVDTSFTSLRYLPHPIHSLPMKVRHKLEADLQMQIESWETIAPHLAGDTREFELQQRNYVAELACAAEIEELASRVIEAWLSFDDATKDLTRFIEWLDLRILITNEMDLRFEGLVALTDQRSYLLISTRWSDEKRRRCLAKMLGMHILGSHSTTRPTAENLETFANEILQRTKANPRSVLPKESTPKYGIDSPAPDLESHFADLVHSAWCDDKITLKTAVTLLRTTERDLQKMSRIE